MSISCTGGCTAKYSWALCGLSNYTAFLIVRGAEDVLNSPNGLTTPGTQNGYLEINCILTAVHTYVTCTSLEYKSKVACKQRLAVAVKEDKIQANLNWLQKQRRIKGSKQLFLASVRQEPRITQEVTQFASKISTPGPNISTVISRKQLWHYLWTCYPNHYQITWQSGTGIPGNICLRV